MNRKTEEKKSEEVCGLINAIYVNPYTDSGLKKLFGDDANIVKILLQPRRHGFYRR